MATNSLTMGKALSCGCRRRENSAWGGLSETPAYRIWSAMIGRCTRPSSKEFERYGARGITVCSRWLSFTAFLEDMGQPPEGLTLERVDNERGYAPGNCRWATRVEQARNRRSNLMIEYRGETKPLAQWADELRLPYKSVWKRIRTFRWSVDRAFSTPF